MSHYICLTCIYFQTLLCSVTDDCAAEQVPDSSLNTNIGYFYRGDCNGFLFIAQMVVREACVKSKRQSNLLGGKADTFAYPVSL